MAAVRRGACQQPSEITDHPEVRPPTDAMSSHPYLLPLIDSALDSAINAVIDSDI